MITVSRHTLDNGLRIVHHLDPTVAMVAVNVMYDVGSRDEEPGLSGMAHLFEHLMFGGSVNIPDFDGAAENAGGWTNAWTSNDFTSFYDVFPAVNAETAFWLESDRMLSLSFNPKVLEVQRKVVIEEFKETCLNKPFGDLWHHLRRLAYRTHPYSYPTIGREIADIERVTETDVKRFFNRHYAPNNAVLSVAGNISFDEVCRLAEKWFGDIPRREIASRGYKAEAPVDKPRSLTVRGNVPCTQIVMAFPMCGYSSPDYAPTDLLSDVLASGKSSRFHKNLVMSTPYFADADASILGSCEPGLFLASARLTDNSDATIEGALQSIRGQLSAIVAEGCSPHELERAKNRYESNSAFNSVGYLNRALDMAQCEINGDDINRVLERYRHVTTDDMARVAAGVLDPQREITLVYRPVD